MTHLSPAVLTLLALVGCGSPSSPTPVELGKSFELKPGQTATVEGLKVTLFRVDDDGRCPTDVVCVWEGDATVKVRLAQGEGAQETRELHSANSPLGSRRITYSGFEIELSGLRPQPHSSSPVKQDDYRATLTVRRAASPAP